MDGTTEGPRRVGSELPEKEIRAGLEGPNALAQVRWPFFSRGAASRHCEDNEKGR